MNDAIVKEWQSWIENGALSVISRNMKPMNRQLFRSRVVKVIKDILEGPTCVGKKCKGRMIFLGFEDDRALNDYLETDAPTVSRLGSRIIHFIGLSKGWMIASGDISSAFLRGDKLEEFCYGEIPEEVLRISELKLPRDSICQLEKAGFGFKDAPKKWNIRFPKDQINLGAKQSALDPCIFMYYDEDKQLYGVCGVHVDDVRCARSPRWMSEIRPQLKALYHWGEWQEFNFRYTGVTFRGIQAKWTSMDMSNYIECLKRVDLSNLKKLIDEGQESIKKLNKTLTVFRGIAGSLQWAATQGRPDILGDVVKVQKGLGSPVVEQLMLGASTIDHLMATPDTNITWKPVPLGDLHIIVCLLTRVSV